MILSELRAQGWRIAAALFGVLAVALLIGCLFLWNGATRANVRADAESRRAQESEARAKALSDALARDGVSDGFTDTARQAMDKNAAAINDRLSAIEGRLHDRPPVPAVCPDPDADLLRESAEATGRFLAAENRLRDLRTAQGRKPD